MEKKNPFSSFDWYFTDASEEDAARFRALKDRPQQTSVLMNVVSADSLTHFALWSQLPPGHPVAELWLETQTDLVATIYLAYGGFFRQALTVLRAWFEIAVHGVYFSGHYGQPDGRYEQWRRGQRNAPAKMQAIAKSLASRTDKALQVGESAILEKLYPVYKVLSLQTHAQGLDIYELQEGRDNVPRYLPKSFDLWYAKVLEAFNAISFLYRVFFPEEIATYLKGSKAELESAVELKNLIGKLIPEFGELVEDVLVLVIR
ncbi:MAG TPA: hypothetical protein VMX16_13905 [Terriglobia bacterium]|nr:hypothetical protein [Terriglobia bacterium]